MNERFYDEEKESTPAPLPETWPANPMDAGYSITDQQRLGIDLLAEGRRLGDVSKEIGVSRQQLLALAEGRSIHHRAKPRPQ